MRTITLTLTVTEEEGARLVDRFIQTAQAVTGEIPDEDEGTPGDPNGDKRDATGVVWNARYHGVKMTKNQDGTWRRKKSMTEQEKADADAYEAGCRGASPVAAVAVNAAPVAQAAAAITTGITAPTPAPAADVPAFLQTGSFAPPVMTMPGMPALAPVAPPPPPSYEELIAAFQATVARVGQPVVEANLPAIYSAAGVTDMTQLNDDPEKRRSVKAGLDALTA